MGAVAKATLASLSGPAALAIGSSALFAAACAAGDAMYPEAGGLSWRNPEALPALAGAAGAGLGALGAAAAGAAGMVQALRGKSAEQARDLGGSLKEAWGALRSHVVFGGAGVGLFAGASAMSQFGQGLDPAGSLGMLLAATPVAAGAAAFTLIGAKEAVQSAAGLASRSLRAGGKGAERAPEGAASAEASPDGLPAAAPQKPEPAQTIELTEEVGSRLGSWRKERSASALGRAPMAPKAGG